MLKIKEWSRKKLYFIGVLIGIALGINICLLILWILGDPFLSWLNSGVL